MPVFSRPQELRVMKEPSERRRASVYVHCCLPKYTHLTAHKDLELRACMLMLGMMSNISQQMSLLRRPLSIFTCEGNKHLRFKVLQIKGDEKQPHLWVWRKQVRGDINIYIFLRFVEELQNECQVMWKAWQMVKARALGGSLFIQALHSRAESSQTPHASEAKRMMKNDFLISARYRLIRLLLTTDTSKNLSTNNYHFKKTFASITLWLLYTRVQRLGIRCFSLGHFMINYR